MKKRKLTTKQFQEMRGRRIVSMALPTELLDQIDDLAGKLNISRSRFIEISISESMQVDSFMIRIITSRLGQWTLDKLRNEYPEVLPTLKEGF